MNRYRIYKNEYDVESVKVGFSWPAFFFGWAWALVKKLYVVGTILFIAQILILDEVIDYDIILGDNTIFSSFIKASEINYVISIIYFFIGILLGAVGNDLRCKNLSKKGYDYIKTIEAYDKPSINTINYELNKSSVNV